MAVQYKIKPITRYVITRHEEKPGMSGSVHEKGTFDNAEIAYQVAYALCRTEHEGAGAPIGSMDFIYPDSPGATIPADPIAFSRVA